MNQIKFMNHIHLHTLWDQNIFTCLIEPNIKELNRQMMIDQYKMKKTTSRYFFPHQRIEMDMSKDFECATMKQKIMLFELITTPINNMQDWLILLNKSNLILKNHPFYQTLEFDKYDDILTSNLSIL